MALAYLLDEHLRGPVWWAIQRNNAHNANRVDAVRVGDPNGPPLGTNDSEVLVWAERESRILITLDEQTMATHLAQHLRDGHHSPGIFTIRPASHLPEIIEFLMLAAFASEADEWRDRIVYVP